MRGSAASVNLLLKACREGRIQNVRSLLRENVSPNEISRFGVPLCEAQISSSALEVTKILIEYGAKPNLIDHRGFFPLFVAAGNDRWKSVKFLFESGADIDLCFKANGWSSLMNAASVGAADSLMELLLCGCNTDIKSADGFTALDIAVGSGHLREAELIRLYLNLTQSK